MRFSVFGKSVVGYKNKIKYKSSQDYLRYENIENGIICSIADGHSGEFFTNSHKGSKFACDAAIEILKKYENEDIKTIKNLLIDKVIQIEIYNKWRDLVGEDMKNTIPKVYKQNYFKYGTTLLISMIKDNYILNIKIGDGEILIKENNNIKKVLPSYKKNIVDCLAEEKSYDKMIYSIIEYKNSISNLIMYSDGFENSFDSHKSMIREIDSTLINYNKNIFSKIKIEKSYDKYLSSLSKNGSLDDISIIFINIM